MKATTAVAALAAVAMFWSGPALAQKAQGKQDCAQPSASVGTEAKAAPEKIEGEITNIDRDRGMVTIRGTDGQTHEFRASKEDVNTFQMGERIEATRRAQAGC